MSTFNFNLTCINGLHQITPKILSDKRGCFIKTFNREVFKGRGIDFFPKEEFFSISHRGVLRGMHFQLPPSDQNKLVYCIEGEILDVVVDLRNGIGYGKVHSQTLDSERREMLFIPRGCGHGFLTLSDRAIVVYQTDKQYDSSADQGILWNSINFEWPVREPIISERDERHPILKEFNSPFVLK
jgi:dTDP-4-dehydrorhamnose 3,5-epimerase